MVWSCLPFIGSGQNHLARHSERGKKTRQTEEEVGRQHQGMDRPGACQVLEGSGEQGEMGGNWLQNHLWCPNDPRGEGMDDDDEPCRFYIKCRKQVIFFSTLNDWLLWCLFTPPQNKHVITERLLVCVSWPAVVLDGTMYTSAIMDLANPLTALVHKYKIPTPTLTLLFFFFLTLNFVCLFSRVKHEIAVEWSRLRSLKICLLHIMIMGFRDLTLSHQYSASSLIDLIAVFGVLQLTRENSSLQIRLVYCTVGVKCLTWFVYAG